MATPLWDIQKGQWVHVEDEHLTSAIATGQFAPPKGEQLYVLSPEGHRARVPLDEAIEAVGAGWKVESSSERRKAYLEKEYGGLTGSLQSAVGGAISGASFGVGPAVLETVAPDTMQSLRFAREQNPGIFTAGEIAGVVGPALLTGGATAVAGAGAKVGAKTLTKKALAAKLAGWTPAGVNAQTARYVQQAAAKRLARAPDSLMPRAIAGLAESVPASVGLTLGHAVFDRQDLDPELLLANVGVGAAFGAGAPVITSALAAPFKTVAPSLGALASRVTGGGNVDSPIKDAVESKAAKWALKRFAEVGGKKKGKIEKLTDFETRQRAVRDAEVLVDNHTKTSLRDMNAARDALEELDDAWGRSQKLKVTEKHFEGVDGVKAAIDADGQVRDIIKDIDDYMGRASEAGSPVGLQSTLRNIRATAVKTRRNIGREFDKTPGGSASPRLAAFARNEVDGLKKSVQRQIRRAGSPRDLSGADREAWEIIAKDQADDVLGRSFAGIETRIRRHLESADVWGEAAAGAQKEINAARAAVFATDDVADKLNLVIGDEAWHPLKTIDDKRIRSLLGEGHHETSVRFDTLNQYYRDVDGLAETFARHIDDPGVAKAAEKARKAAQGTLKTLKEARVDMEAFHALGGLEQTLAGTISMGAIVGSIGGTMVGGPVGGVAGSLIGAILSRPDRAIRMAATYEKMRGTFQKNLRNRLGKYLKGASNAGDLVLRAERPMRLGALSMKIGAPGQKEEKSRTRAYSRIVSELEEPHGNALEFATKTVEPIHDLSPDTASAFVATAARGRAWLLEKARAMFGPNAGQVLRRRLPPPESQLASWERYALTVDDPLAAVERLLGGHTTVEEVETLQAVYPGLYSEVVHETMMALAELDTLPPRRVQLQLSVFLGIPLDATVSREFAQAMFARDMQTAGVPQTTNPAGHAGVTNRGQTQSVLSLHQTRGQRNETA